MRGVGGLVWQAWLRGALLIVLIVSADSFVRYAGYGQKEWLLYLVWGLFMVAVYITTYSAPIYKIITGVSHAVTIAALFTLARALQSFGGAGEGIGAEHGYGAVFALLYVSAFIPALIAAAAAFVVSVSKRKNIPKL